jgi:hypothetical protein
MVPGGPTACAARVDPPLVHVILAKQPGVKKAGCVCERAPRMSFSLGKCRGDEMRTVSAHVILKVERGVKRSGCVCERVPRMQIVMGKSADN